MRVLLEAGVNSNEQPTERRIEQELLICKAIVILSSF